MIKLNELNDESFVKTAKNEVIVQMRLKDQKISTKTLPAHQKLYEKLIEAFKKLLKPKRTQKNSSKCSFNTNFCLIYSLIILIIASNIIFYFFFVTNINQKINQIQIELIKQDYNPLQRSNDVEIANSDSDIEIIREPTKVPMRDNIELIESLATVANSRKKAKKLRKKSKIIHTENLQSSIDIFNNINSLDEKKCPIKSIDTHGTKFASMGMNFCNWMNNIGAESNLKDKIYITKYYRGSSVTICKNLSELNLNNCYQQLPLFYSFYGTGHVIYKNYMFYYHREGNSLVRQNVLDASDVHLFNLPDDAKCCKEEDDTLYSVKQSGFFDFEVDENGLWLIYKQDKNLYVISRIKNYQSSLNEIEFDTKKFLKLNNENSMINMFVACGQLYGLAGDTSIRRLCDLLNGRQDCLNSNDSSEEREDNSKFQIQISRLSDVTSLSYNPERKQTLNLVDGANFVYYRLVY